MDQTLINIALALFIFIGGLIMGALGWFARTIWDKLQEQDRRINDLEVKLVGGYVSHNDLAGAINDIKAAVVQVSAEFRNDITYIRARVDNLPQRREGDRN